MILPSRCKGSDQVAFYQDTLPNTQMLALGLARVSVSLKQTEIIRP